MLKNLAWVFWVLILPFFARLLSHNHKHKLFFFPAYCCRLLFLFRLPFPQMPTQSALHDIVPPVVNQCKARRGRHREKTVSSWDQLCVVTWLIQSFSVSQACLYNMYIWQKSDWVIRGSDVHPKFRLVSYPPPMSSLSIICLWMLIMALRVNLVGFMWVMTHYRNTAFKKDCFIEASSCGIC